MCGIIGVIESKEAAPILLEGLRRLEYRGYDSAGVAVLGPTMPVVGSALSGQLFEKTASNLQEAAARGAHLIVLSNEEGAAKLGGCP